MKITKFNSLKRLVEEGKIQASIRGYREGLITSPRGIVKHFALMLASGKVFELPLGERRVAQELIDARVVTQSGRILKVRG
jgi:hypothetical protein